MSENNIVMKLLSLDSSKAILPKGEIKLELKRYGDTFNFPIIALDAETATLVQDLMFKMRADTQDMHMDSYRAKCEAIINGCPDVFQNRDIQRHFDTVTAQSLINKLLTGDELDKLYEAIMELTEDYKVPNPSELDDEIKNS